MEPGNNWDWENDGVVYILMDMGNFYRDDYDIDE